MRTHRYRLLRYPAFMLLVLASTLVRAQDEEEEEMDDQEEKDTRTFKERFFVGGGINLSFGTVTNIGVEPIVGYKIDRDNRWSVGVGGSYNYYRSNYYNYTYETSIYGYKAFTRYKILSPLFVAAEFNHLSYQLYSAVPGVQQRLWIPFLLVGGGYAANIGGHTSLTFTLMWDVIQDPHSPYRAGSPFISGGFAVGF
ncbi:MAG: hypothetical protein WAU70_12845 [Flavobacteriales bacterium]